jgi:hypothetical protein
MPSERLITPSQLALFSRSPVIGAWWEEVHATDPQRAPRPATKPLDELLFDSGLKHEKVLIAALKRKGKKVAELRGKQDASDYAATIEAMRSGADYIWQASLHNDEMRGSADLLERIERVELHPDRMQALQPLQADLPGAGLRLLRAAGASAWPPA